jgi:formate dehydrogenase major subunit
MDSVNTAAKQFVSHDVMDRRWLDVNVPCQAACPIRTDIPGYIEAILHGEYAEAYRINRLDNIFPGVLGRVCHRPCEPVCRHGRAGLGEPVNICFLKRSAADLGMKPLGIKPTPNGKRVCIIGAGPAGLTAANDLAIRGYDVTVLEQYEEPGGMLRYGIPPFRLPVEIVARDIASITSLGVKIETGRRVDTQKELGRLQKAYDAVLLTAGCMLATRTELPGMDAEGFFWGLDFMMASNRGELDVKPERVVVIGGGFTAVDCTRTAYRLGAKDITLAYRRTRDYLRVGPQEVEAMETEGIHMTFMVSPVEVLQKDGRVTGLRLVRNEVDAQGKMTPVPGSEMTLAAETVILAIGQSAEDLPGGKQEEPPRAGDDKLFMLAGDFRLGSGTVIEACADGRKVARQVHERLSGVEHEEVVAIDPVELEDLPRWREHDFIPAEPMPELPLEERGATDEVERGYTRIQSLVEAHRCYLCHYNFEIDVDRCIYCMKCIEVMPVDCIHLVKDVTEREDGGIQYAATDKWSEVEAIAIDNDQCIRCGNCVRVCPVDCISISRFHLRVDERPVAEARTACVAGEAK